MPRRASTTRRAGSTTRGSAPATRRSSRSRPAELPFPLTGPYISIPSDIRRAAAAVVERQPAAAGRRRTSRCRRPIWAATRTGCGTCARSIPGSTSRGVHAADADRAADLQPLLDDGHAQLPPRAHDAELRDREVPGRRGRAHRARLPEVQRPAPQRAAPHGEPLHRERQLHAVEVHGAPDPGRHHAQRGHGVRRTRPIPPTTTVPATPTAATCST